MSAVASLLFVILALPPDPARGVEEESVCPYIEEEDSPGRGGTIQGRVLYDGKPPVRQKLAVVKDVDICGKKTHYDQRLVVGKENGVKNTVVSLTSIRGGKPLSTLGTQFVLDQSGCSYNPHVLLLPLNTPVRILNNDGILHNIHTFCTKNRPANIAQTKLQKELEMKFKTVERVPVKCDIHGWMSAWFIIVDHPYHFVSDDEGRFILSDIPPGTYTVNCWQELLGEQTAQVIVTGGSSTTLDFHYGPGNPRATK